MITHEEAVEAALLLDKYCGQAGMLCNNGKCVFRAMDCPFEFGRPLYDKRNLKELRSRAKKMDKEEK